ncbi:MAG: hypothetical protein ACTS40_00065 [Candidatus Hodgkinia cicadicola]
MILCAVDDAKRTIIIITVVYWLKPYWLGWFPQHYLFRYLRSSMFHWHLFWALFNRLNFGLKLPLEVKISFIPYALVSLNALCYLHRSPQ